MGKRSQRAFGKWLRPRWEQGVGHVIDFKPRHHGDAAGAASGPSR